MNKISACLAFLLLFFVFNIAAQNKCDAPNNTANLPCIKTILKLGKSEFEIRTYTKPIKNRVIDRTFVVVHHNEQKGLLAAKKVIAADGGRLIEVVSLDSNNQPRRYLHFDFADKTNVCFDPNRMYSKIGIRKFFLGYPKSEDNSEDICSPVLPEMFDSESDDLIREISHFGTELLKIVTDNFRHRFIIGVHNNVDLKLDITTWNAPGGEAKSAVGIFRANNAAHDAMIDADDFILVSNLNLFAKVIGLGEPYNIALQEDKTFLDKNKSAIDDGSMSIYFGTNFFGKTARVYDYINIEAEGKDDAEDEPKARQTRMIRLINKLKI